MKTISLVLAALLLAPAAHADKFHLGTEADAKKFAEGSSPNVLEGVLLSETDTHYTVRIVGGQVVLAKKDVWKVEKDASMTVDSITKAEQDLAAKSASEARVRDVQAAEAAARNDRRAVDAGVPADQPVAPAPTRPEFDPVLGVVNGVDVVSLDDVEAAWKLTKDRRYLKMLRKMRRMR